jgi:hypothetical protein
MTENYQLPIENAFHCDVRKASKLQFIVWYMYNYTRLVRCSIIIPTINL